MPTIIYADLIRFLLAGGLNTILTALLFYILLLFFSHTTAYLLSWIAGITFIILLYPTKVFPGGKRSKKRIIAIITSYLMIFALSLWSLDQLVISGINPRIAVLAILILSSTLNFISMRFLFRGNFRR